MSRDGPEFCGKLQPPTCRKRFPLDGQIGPLRLCAGCAACLADAALVEQHPFES